MGLGAIAPGTEDAGCEEGAPEERLLCSWIAAAAAWGGGGPPDGFLLIDPVSFEAALDKGDLCGEGIGKWLWNQKSERGKNKEKFIIYAWELRFCIIWLFFAYWSYMVNMKMIYIYLIVGMIDVRKINMNQNVGLLYL